LARRSDEELAGLLEKFVCVRVVQSYGMDLSLFQFDSQLTWAVFLLTADKTIYGRYGTRASGRDRTASISLAGLKEALRGALELHGAYPRDRGALAGKTGPAPLWPAPERIPALETVPWWKGRAVPADGSEARCIHCHWISSGEAWSLRATRKPVPDKLLWAHPTPEVLGLTLDRAERATVAKVSRGSEADRAGLRTGDRLLRLEGQSILSIADVQWVLHNAPGVGSLEAEVGRGGEKLDVSLALEPGWRRRDSLKERTIAGLAAELLAGTGPLKSASKERTAALGLADGEMALELESDWQTYCNPSAKELRKGDVIVAVDGRKDLTTEDAFLAHFVQRTAPGQEVELTVLRGGKSLSAKLRTP